MKLIDLPARLKIYPSPPAKLAQIANEDDKWRKAERSAFADENN
jgi:hypothetical protein